MEGKSTQPLSVSQLLKCAESIRVSNALPVHALLSSISCGSLDAFTGQIRSAVEEILSFMPVLLVESGDDMVLINGHELTFDSTTDAMADLLSGRTKQPDEQL